MDKIVNHSPSDKELINEFKKGNVRGFNGIVLKYQKRIYWLIRRIVLNHEDADDITQDVFIKVYTALKDFREDSNLFTWLYRIAVNSALNHVKSSKVKNTIRLDDILLNNEIYDNIAESNLEIEDRKKQISNAVSQLPPQQKAVFLMRYYDELSYEEISEILDRSVGGIKANYFHAVKKIGAYIKTKSISI